MVRISSRVVSMLTSEEGRRGEVEAGEDRSSGCEGCWDGVGRRDLTEVGFTSGKGSPICFFSFFGVLLGELIELSRVCVLTENID
jgi:hypothetical protein